MLDTRRFRLLAGRLQEVLARCQQVRDGRGIFASPVRSVKKCMTWELVTASLARATLKPPNVENKSC